MPLDLSTFDLKLGCDWPPVAREQPLPLPTFLSLSGFDFPDSFDAEDDLIGTAFPGRMWLNNTHPDCVIAMIANHTRRLEYIEQEFLINITDENVKKEWLRQTGNNYNAGLYMHSAMKEWQNTGWYVNGGLAEAKVKAKVPGCWRKKTTPTVVEKLLNIHCFAEVYTPDDLRSCIFALHGAQIAVMLTETDIKQFKAGEPWHLTGNDGGKVGGHALDVPAYKHNIGTAKPDGFECWTWAKRQPFDEDWFVARKYDAYGVVDAADKFLAVSKIDPEKLEAILREIAKP